jgi:hypothetical protein
MSSLEHNTAFDQNKHDVHLFGIQALRVADCTQDQFDALQKHVSKVVSTPIPGRLLYHNRAAEHPLDPEVVTFFGTLALPDTLNAQDAWLQFNANYSDVLELSFSHTSQHAVMVIADSGVFILTDCEMPWREAQRFDLCPSATDVLATQDDQTVRMKQLRLSSLK